MSRIWPDCMDRSADIYGTAFSCKGYGALLAERDALAARLAEAEALLRVYGGHIPPCTGRPCECGFKAAWDSTTDSASPAPCDNCGGTGQVFTSLAGEEPDLHPCRECNAVTQPSACQHDLLLPATTVVVDVDGFGGRCIVCWETWRTKPRAADPTPQPSECRCASYCHIAAGGSFGGSVKCRGLTAPDPFADKRFRTADPTEVV